MKPKTSLLCLKAVFLLFFLALTGNVFAQGLCISNSQCNDSDSATIDLCVRPDTNSSGCTNLSCVPQCLSNSDCNDGDSSTSDVCAGAGRCAAECVHLTACGNGNVDDGETECTCPQDAGSCSGSFLSVCGEYACIGTECKQTIALGCCGNNICEFKETYSSCEQDCKPKNIEIEIIGINGETFFVRGEEALIKARITADGTPIKNALVNVEGFFGKIQLLNDGKHGDDFGNDNVYANYFMIPKEVQADEYILSINALFEGFRGIKDFNFVIAPTLDVRLETQKDNYSLGETISISGVVLRKSTAIRTNTTVTVYSNNIKTDEKKLVTNDSGEFSYAYRTSFLEEDGEWRLEVFASDEFGNTGFVQKTILVSDNKITAYLLLELLQETREKYARGESIKLSVQAVQGTDQTVTGAEVTALTPDNKIVDLNETEPGIYEGEVVVGVGFPLGMQEIRINALKKENNDSFLAGTKNVSFSVQKVDLTIEIIEPRRFSFQAGEEVEFVARVFYPDKKPASASRINASVNGKNIELQAVAKGIYSAKYVVTKEDEPRLVFEVQADDGFENIGTNELELEVSGISVYYYLRQYFYEIIAGTLVLIGVAIFLFAKINRKTRLSGLDKNEQVIMEKIKNIQQQYFREGTIDKKNYDKLMEKAQAELENTKKTRQQLLAGKKKG